MDELLVRRAGAYRAESRLCSVAIPDAGSGASFLAERTEAGLAAKSVRIIHATLRTMLAEAVRDELVERNVASIVRGPRIDHEEVRPWSLDEAATFLAAASAHRLSALFAVGVAVGLRRGELLALAWDDVDLDGGDPSGAANGPTLAGSRSGVWAAEVDQIASEHPATGVLARGAAVSP